MSNDFDIACWRMVKDDPLPFLRWLFSDFDALARQVGWIDTRRTIQDDESDQTGDIVFEIEILLKAMPLWALLLEFQIEPDPDMFARLLIFLGTLYREKRPDPLRGSRYCLAASVINLTGTTQSVPASMSFVWPGKEPMSCILGVNERHLAMEDARVTLAAIDAGRYDRAILPWCR